VKSDCPREPAGILVLLRHCVGPTNVTCQASEPHEIIYFKLYKSQIPVVEQAIETAALMLGSNKSRGYCLEMICADFLAGACLDSGQPELLLHTISRLFGFLPGEQKQAFAELASQSMQGIKIC